MDVSELCVICKETFDENTSPAAYLGKKGSASINQASVARNDSNTSSIPGQKVHQECRRKYCNPQQISREIRQQQEEHGSISDRKRPVLRSSEDQFHYDADCLFCGQSGGSNKSHNVVSVRTIAFKNSVLEVCDRRGDAWAETVEARLLHVHDLPAADAIYHQECSVNFRTDKQIPTVHQASEACLKRAKMGRPQTDERTDAFLEVAGFLEENDDEQITVNDLIDRMEHNLANSEHEAYSYKHMKSKLHEHFGSRIMQTEINGKSNVITFRNKAATVIQEFYNQNKSADLNTEKLKMVQTTVKLIQDDIKAVETSADVYPAFETFQSEEDCIQFLPETLRVFLEGLFVGKSVKMKVASIGQAIMQACRPRVLLAPLQIGLGVQLHHHFASRFLIDSLHKHGFCCSYQEISEFERNAASSYGTDIPDFTDQFVQYVADNVDHNIRTLDGHGTFHGMGMIAAITPGTKASKPVRRVKVTPSDISKVARVQIRYHREERQGLTAVAYQKLYDVKAHDPTANLDILWKASMMFGSPRPSWSGMMQKSHQGVHPGKSSVMFLPMIDMSASDVTCIYSTLEFISLHARQYNVTPIITFDQPLWWKALNIIDAEPVASKLHDIVLRLGGFHTLMSFLGCIGHLMAASGLQQVLELIYAPNAVVHMLSGKAIARAVRAHLIVDAALNALVISNTFNVSLPSQLDELDDKGFEGTETLESDESTREATGTPMPSNPDMQEVCGLYDKLMEGTMPAAEVCQADVVFRIKNLLENKTQTLKDSSRTATLWLQYMEMVDILRMFIRAERTGNWTLHLHAVSEMLPYMAASGHNLYTKSARMYLQRMSNLQDEFPDVHQHFENGLHVVRRSDRLWAGLSSDLVIEQVLMRSMKTSGGLTRGRGMTEQQRSTWLMSMPACAEVNRVMQELTRISYDTGEQNKDMTKARQARDWKDTLSVLEALKERNPFTDDQSLRNIITGVHANNNVNVDTAKTVGKSILDGMDGETVAEYTFKRKDQVVTLDTKSTVKIDGESVQIDPQLLFQRLTLAAKTADDLQDVFKYELCSHPTALFDPNQLLRQPQKPVLADAIWALLTPDDTSIPGEVQYVLDGGALVQRIPWTLGATYLDICHVYTEYVTRKYGEAVVVFDGYDGTSTKDMTHQRRSKGKVGETVTFAEDMHITMSKEQFLANNMNKQRFINMLSKQLVKANCHTHHAPGDADLLIVQTAVESATLSDTVLVGDDTDLLILLCYHACLDSHDIFFRPEPKKTTKHHRVWNIKAIKEQLGGDVSNHILFLHAILGCDTTSRLYGIGKGSSLRKFKKSNHFREQAKVFHEDSASQDAICAAGEQALVSLYGGKAEDTLNSLRYKRFCEKVACSSTSHVQPQSLPPTSDAAKYHSLRVYCQIQQWKGSGDDISPTEWGWSESNGGLAPMQTDLPPAPQELLRVIRCNCKSDCGSARCSCKKHDVECSPACGNCRGSGCSNSSRVLLDEDDENDTMYL